MNEIKFWFITGSQELYGEATLREVAKHSAQIVAAFNQSEAIPHEIVCKPVVKSGEEILAVIAESCADKSCAGLITWMHTFSPSKMWINGLKLACKPILHLHTQFNRDIPWNTIDMDFMNTNQSAHGDREHGYIFTRMGIRRKVIAGHYQSPETAARIGGWMKAASAAYQGAELKIMRVGDNMRDVAVTEGDKVEAQIKLGWSVNTYGAGALAEAAEAVTDARVSALVEEYIHQYSVSFSVLNNAEAMESVRYQARLEAALLTLMEDGGFSGITDTFEDLYGLKQLPGLAAQRLMARGYGFGPEGDWKVAALLRVMKQMAGNKGTSLMEDYTYHLEPGNEMILGAHMLEICPTIAAGKPSVEVWPLGIGGKEPPARLVFTGRAGKAVCASLIDMGNRLRLIILDVEAFAAERKMPKLPVASVLWRPEPDMFTGSEAWIYAGGAHHTVFSYDVSAETLLDWADILGIETVYINKNTKLHELRQSLQTADILWKLR